MFSKSVLGTAKKKIKLNWWEYWIGHCWMTGWQSIQMTFKNWSDLMGSNYKDYALLKEDDPEEECTQWFWATLGEDECYPKEFLESLLEMVDRIDRGEEKLIPMDDAFFDRLKNLVKDVELDEEEE